MTWPTVHYRSDRKQAQLTAMRLGARAIERLVSKFDETMALAGLGHSRSDDHPLGAGVGSCERGSARSG